MRCGAEGKLDPLPLDSNLEAVYHTFVRLQQLFSNYFQSNLSYWKSLIANAVESWLTPAILLPCPDNGHEQVISACLLRFASRKSGLSHLPFESSLAQSLLLPAFRLLAVCSHFRVQLNQRKFILRWRSTQRVCVPNIVRNPIESYTYKHKASRYVTLVTRLFDVPGQILNPVPVPIE